MCDTTTTDTVPSDAHTYAVQGMTCTSCAGKVTGAVSEVPGVEATDVDLATGTLVVNGDDLDDDAIRAAITAAGYRTA